MTNTAGLVERFWAWSLTLVVESQEDLCGTGILLTLFFEPLFLFVDQAIGITLNCGLAAQFVPAFFFSPGKVST